jgi:hypothetical protein
VKKERSEGRAGFDQYRYCWESAVNEPQGHNSPLGLLPTALLDRPLHIGSHMWAHRWCLPAPAQHGYTGRPKPARRGTAEAQVGVREVGALE